MNKVAEFITKSAFGVTRTYPSNDTAKLLTGLTTKTTVDKADLLIMSALGYHIIIDGRHTV